MCSDFDFKEFIGKTQTSYERINHKDLTGLAALLDYPFGEADPETSLPWWEDDLPPFAHWLNANPHCRQSLLNQDGHPRQEDFLPRLPFPRRMWAGSRVECLGAYSAEQELRHRKTIASINHKKGRSGEMIFITLLHEFFSGKKLVLKEEQDLVYREAATRPLPAPVNKPEEEITAGFTYDWCQKITPDPVLLFRYSAVTFNGHRIHYDRDYATQIERYPGLVVQGPLTVTLLLDLYLRNNPEQRLRSFSFRGLSPLYDLGDIYLLGRANKNGADMWAVGPDGAPAMQIQLETL